MKKHGERVIHIGVLVSVFGLLVMSSVSIVTGLILGSSIGSASSLIKNAVQSASDLSGYLLMGGAAILLLGIYLRTRAD